MNLKPILDFWGRYFNLNIFSKRELEDLWAFQEKERLSKYKARYYYFSSEIANQLRRQDKKIMGPSDWKEASEQVQEAVNLLCKVRRNYPLPKNLDNRLSTAEDKAQNLAWEFIKKWNEFKALCDLGK